MITDNQHETSWRPCFELGPSVYWGVASLTTPLLSINATHPTLPLYVASLAFAGMSFWRGKQAHSNLERRLSLFTKFLPVTPTQDLQAWVRTHPKDIWLGYGFEWLPVHSQRIYDLKKLDVSELRPPKWFSKLARKMRPATIIEDETPIGEPWVHGVETNEINVHFPLKAQEGHTLILGTTGAGKTRLYEILCSQAIYRGDVVIALDPKGDQDWEARMRLESERCGRPFVYIHLAHPEISARLNPLKNWSAPTDIASRLKSVFESMGAGASASFAINFAWRVIDDIVNGMLVLGERPTIKAITNHCLKPPQELATKVLRKILADSMGQQLFDLKFEQLKTDSVKKSNLDILNDMFKQLQQSPDREIKEGQSLRASDKDIASLVETCLHDKSHYDKIMIEILPLLKMLSAGEIGSLLSPDAGDVDDERPIWDFKKVIDQNAVVYIGLNMLADDTIGTAVGTAFIEDLKATAGALYNYGKADKKVSVYLDEAAEAVNKGYIQILNKARGAGFNNTFATQTLADFEAKLGQAAEAEQVLGNANNLIVLRIVDVKTQELISKKFSNTTIHLYSETMGTSVNSEKNIAHFNGAISRGRKEQENAMIPCDIFGKLPNLQYFAMLAGGKVIKGRLSLLRD